MKHISVENYKGIEKIFLNGLGKINVICGKNNSGKSSILECLINPTYSNIGIEISQEIIDLLEKKFESQAKQYSNPNPSNSIQWFEKFLNCYVKEHSIWYDSERVELNRAFSSGMKEDVYLKGFSENTFKFDILFSQLFEQRAKEESICLIPPKRNYNSQEKIDLDKDLLPNGEGTINKLFNLKNNPLNSDKFKIFQTISQKFKQISNCTFNITPLPNNILNLSFQIDGLWLDAESCGLGLKDLLFIVTFIHCNEAKTILVEEPENHLHADFQKKLLVFMREYVDKQFIISTHSNVFLDTTQVDKIFYCWYDKVVNISDKTSMSKIIDSLGYSIKENLTSDALIFVEGPTDIPVLKRVLELTGIINNANIKFWPLGGDIMASLDLSIFSGKNKIFAIVDQDPGSTKIRRAFKKNCLANNISYNQLERYSIENYFPLHLLKEVFPNQIKKALITLQKDISVDDQIGFKAKSKTIKGKNHIISHNLEIQHIRDTDLWELALKIKREINNET